MKIKLGPEILASYKRLAYHVWYALAEFVDNSTQAYFNNRKRLDDVFKVEETMLKVEIETGSDAKGEFIRISDNSIGMSEAELENAVYVGKPPLDTRGRSRYGLGLKTGASWFGDLWSVESKKLDETVRHTVTVDVQKVANGALNLPHKRVDAPKEEHGTTIEIRQLHRRLAGRGLSKVKNYLRSLYRRDLSSGLLMLVVKDEVLSWDNDVDSKILMRRDGSKAKQSFQFKVKGKQVSGWAAVLEKGSRKHAGFSIIQSNRVITGWPDSYRPETIFGAQEGGSNDLVNQRLFGELVLEQFEVSHTKDQILFEDGEQELLEAKLQKVLAKLRQLALSHRKDVDERLNINMDTVTDSALNVLEREIESDSMQMFLKAFELPKENLIKQANRAVQEAVTRRLDPNMRAMVGATAVLVYLAKDMSVNDPYVIIESTQSEKSVIVIINRSHPHWLELTNEESVRNFIRHCTYDGVAEWKAFFATGKLEPNTIKLIKDNLLRVPMKVADGAI